MEAVVTPAMNCAEIVGMIGATLALLDQMVSRVGAGLTANVTDAVVAGDDRSRQLAPCLGAVGTVDTVTAHALGRSPSNRAVEWRFPGHSCHHRSHRIKSST